MSAAMSYAVRLVGMLSIAMASLSYWNFESAVALMNVGADHVMPSGELA